MLPDEILEIPNLKSLDLRDNNINPHTQVILSKLKDRGMFVDISRCDFYLMFYLEF